jgi:hypothetical protein
MHWPDINLQEDPNLKKRGLTKQGRPGEAWIIILNSHPRHRDPLTTFCHELGHVVEQYIFGMMQGWDRNGGREGDWEGLRRVERELDASNGIASLVRLKNRLQNQLDKIQNDKLTATGTLLKTLEENEKNCRLTLNDINHQFPDTERWANAYSQFVIQKSGMPELEEELAWSLSKYDPPFLNGTWARTDFEAIFHAINALFGPGKVR